MEQYDRQNVTFLATPQFCLRLFHLCSLWVLLASRVCQEIPKALRYESLEVKEAKKMEKERRRKQGL